MLGLKYQNIPTYAPELNNFEPVYWISLMSYSHRTKVIMRIFVTGCN